MKDLDDFTIAIVGLGLMGGSLAMALKKNRVGRWLLGLDANPQAVTRARALGVIDAPCESFCDADLIVLAMPVRAIVQWLNTNGRDISSDGIVMDLGSTKRAIVTAMEHVAAQCIGGHPMCGKETAGIESADAHLFFGAKFVLTPTAHTTSETLRIAQTLVRRMGAQSIVMAAEAHDRIVAAISHLPYLLSVNLVNSIAALHDERAQLLAASGYQSMTRLAASQLEMMADIVATNRLPILDMLDRYQAELAHLRAAIAAGHEESWRARLEQAQKVKSRE